MPLHRRVMIAAGLLVCLAGAAGAKRTARGVSRLGATHADFDWDGNVLLMPTKLYLKTPRGELAVSASQFVRIAGRLGTPGAYRDVHIDRDPVSGTFRDMHDQAGRNLFLEEVREAVMRGTFGPEWPAFVEATSTKRSARRTGVITGRNQSRATVHEGLRWLVSAGMIRHAPPLANIFTVNEPGAMLDRRPLTGTTEERKLAVTRRRLTRIQAGSRGLPRVWRFSDDDRVNITHLERELARDAHLWPDVAVKLRLTGDEE